MMVPRGMSTSESTRWILLNALLLLAFGCSSPVPPPALVENPAPDLSEAEEVVRRQIEDKVREVESLTDAGGVELGTAYGELGLLYLTYTFYEAAEASFTNARILAADDPRWPYLLGYLFQVRGRLEEASSVFERVLELTPNDAPALIRLGRVKIELGDDEGARPLFERVLSEDPESAAALDGLGKVAAARGDAAEAVEYFERALELQIRASSVHHALGLAYRKLGDFEKAELHLGMGGNSPVQIVDPYLSTITRLGRSAEIYFVRAAQAESELRWDQAAANYRKALEIDPTDFVARKALGFNLEKLGDVEGAEEQLQEAIRIGTTGDAEMDVLKRSEMLRVLGGLRALQGRDEEAIAAFLQGLELDPERLDTRHKLANALARQGRLEEALEHYDRVLAVRSDFPQVLVGRATAHINLGRAGAARADFRRAIEVAPEDPQVRVRFAEALEHLGDRAGAAEQRAAAGRLAATDPKLQSRLLADAGRKQLAAGDYDGALESFSEAVGLDLSNVDARYQRATILGHLGRFAEALEELSWVLAAAPQHGPARRAEVTAHLLQGRWPEARERLEQGLEAMPRDRDLAHALARLLAVAPVPGARDGDRALSMATQVHQAAQRADTAETLAMAFAETGRFAEAQELQRQLVAAAQRDVGGRMAGRWQRQLESYQQGRPWRAQSPDEVIVVLIAPGKTAG